MGRRRTRKAERRQQRRSSWEEWGGEAARRERRAGDDDDLWPAALLELDGGDRGGLTSGLDTDGAPAAKTCGRCREFVEDGELGRGTCLHPGSGVLHPWTDTAACDFWAASGRAARRYDRG